MTTHSFGDIDAYQRKKTLRARLEFALIALGKKEPHPIMAEKISQFCRNLTPINSADDARLPGGDIVKHGFICRIDRREACLLAFLRYVVMEWWKFEQGEREEYESIAAALDTVVEHYDKPKVLPVTGSVRDGFMFDVKWEEAGKETEGGADEQN